MPASFRAEQGSGPSDVVPDAMICFKKYWATGQLPPALLMLEVLSFSNRENADRDLVTKAEIYATLEIPAYWVIDRRDQSVWVHTSPRNGQYDKRGHCLGDTILAAPRLEFLQLPPHADFRRVSEVLWDGTARVSQRRVNAGGMWRAAESPLADTRGTVPTDARTFNCNLI